MLTGSFLSVTGTTASATLEAGESSSHHGSVWWSWTAPQTGLTSVMLDADAHGAGAWVYTGDSLSNLAPAPGLWIGNTSFPRPLTFTATAGQQYQIAVGWSESYGGPISLVLAQSALPAVSLITPTNSQYYYSGDPILLSANLSAQGGTIREVAYYNQDSGALLAVVTNAPWTATIFITNTGQGSPGDILGAAIARVTDSLGLVAYSQPHRFTVLPRPPVNDTFENRLVLEGCSLSVTGSTANAWAEGYGTGSGPSVWWSCRRQRMGGLPSTRMSRWKASWVSSRGRLCKTCSRLPAQTRNGGHTRRGWPLRPVRVLHTTS